jgi:hypothetical protein
MYSFVIRISSLSWVEPLYLFDILFSIKFPFKARFVHVAHIPEDCPFSPGAVMFAEAPCYASESIGITPI